MLAMDGVLIIDKPVGLTSHDVISQVRRIIGLRRAGHTGTLDPFATGVLVVLLGRATRLAQFLSGADKEYAATIRLGYATDTGDITGKPLSAVQACPGFEAASIEAALLSLRGEIEQTPPMYSAKKVQGRKLYEMARRGEEITRAAVRVKIHQFEVVRRANELLQHNEDGSCDLAVNVVCSAGTYVRTLAESVGQLLGIGAHLSELRRTRAGCFKIEDAISLSQLEHEAEAGKGSRLVMSPDAALSHLPFVRLSAEESKQARNGIGVPVLSPAETKWLEGQQVRMRNEGDDLLAIGFYDEVSQLLRPRVVIAPE
ncbi:MAG: tRNA pseudouridine(55) synthase TruB [Pyrinomonadaceae bacterium]